MSKISGRTGLAVLAAGAGRRFGVPKAEVVVDGLGLLERATAVALASGVGPVAAVTRHPLHLPDVVALSNPEADDGQRSSLTVAVTWAAGAGLDALGVLLVDQPGVGPSAIADVVAGWSRGRVARAVYPDGPGHPLVMGLAHWHGALAMAGPDEGARSWLRRHADLVDDVAVAGSGFDIDTRADLDTWRQRP